MNLTKTSSESESSIRGWHDRGYLPHFDGGPLPQFITLHLADSVPMKVVERWQQQLGHMGELEQRVVVRQRIEKYLDLGYGQCFLKDSHIAAMVQKSLLAFDRLRYKLFA